MCAATTCCDVCATLPFNVRALTSSVGGAVGLDDQHANVLQDDPMALHKSSSGDSQDAVERQHQSSFTSKRLERICKEIYEKCGGSVREIAHLSCREVKIGKRVGKGGTASVYHVTGFALTPFPRNELHKNDHQVELRQALKDSSMQPQGRYVLKRLSKNFMSSHHEDDPPKEVNKFARAALINMLLEAQFLRVFDHPNIVKLTAMGECDSENFFLIMTYLPESMEERIISWRKQVKRNTKKLLQREKTPVLAKLSHQFFKPDYYKKQQYTAHLELRKLMYERLYVAQDIAAAVGYLHEQRILYRDLKTSNIGFDSEGTVKLFDFGISRFLPTPEVEEGEHFEDSFDMSKVGTKMFMAPGMFCFTERDIFYAWICYMFFLSFDDELTNSDLCCVLFILSTEIAEKRSYGVKADCYSFGVLLWQLLAMANPRPVYTPYLVNEEEAAASAAFNKILSTNRRGPRYEFPLCACWPMFVQSLLRRIFQRNPRLRPNMAEIERKLESSLEKLWKEIQQDEETMFGKTTAPCTPETQTDSRTIPIQGSLNTLPYMFGLDRQRTFEMELEHEF